VVVVVIGLALLMLLFVVHVGLSGCGWALFTIEIVVVVPV